MTTPMHFFHVLTFVLFLSFPFSFAHFHDVIPRKEFDSKSSDSPSYAPSPYSGSSKPSMTSGPSTNQCPCTCSASEASNGSGNTASGSGGASAGSSSSGSGSSSGSFSGSSSFGASAGSKFSGSSSMSGSFLGSSSVSQGSSSDLGASMSSTSSDSGSSSSDAPSLSASLGPSSSGLDASMSSSFSGSGFSSSSSSSDSSASMGPSSSSSMGPSSSSSDSGSSSSSSDASGGSSSSSSMAPNYSGSSSDSYAPMGSSSSNSGSGFDSSTESGFGSFQGSSSYSGSDAGSGSWRTFSDYTGSDSASSPASGPSSWSGSGDSSTSSGSSDSSESGDSITSGSSDDNSAGASTASDSSSDMGSSTYSGSSNNGDNNMSINFSGNFGKVLAFGDSYTDTGNAQLLGTVKNFVVSFMTRLFQRIDPNFNLAGRSSNGRLIVDFLCDSLNISTLQPYKAISTNGDANFNSGVNFAIGGSTSLSADFYVNGRINNNLLWQGIPPGFQTQIDWFNNYLKQMACSGKSDEECRQDIGRHLIWLGQIGVDDYSRIFGSAISLRWLAQMTIDHISKILTTVLDSGAKTIVVQGLPPLGCCPIAKAFAPQFLKDEMGCSAIINKAVIAHNELLQNTLEQFRTRYINCSIGYADFFNAYKTIMGNLEAFGFQDGSSACCGFGGGLLNFNLNLLCGMAGTRPCNNPGAHVHWDGIHLTEAMHKQITNLFLYKGFIKPSFTSLCSPKRSGN